MAAYKLTQREKTAAINKLQKAIDLVVSASMYVNEKTNQANNLSQSSIREIRSIISKIEKL